MTRSTSKRFFAFILTLALVLTQLTILPLTAFAAENDPPAVAFVKEYYAGLTGTATQQQVVQALLLNTGMKASQFANGPVGNDYYNYNEFAKIAGFTDNWDLNPTQEISLTVAEQMAAAMSGAYDGLYNAVNAEVPAPYFVNGMAVPIFPYGSGTYPEYINTEDGIARFIVYVETDLDTDGDGKLDLVKTLVQLPRAAVDKGMKVATLYEARPYIEGTGSQSVPSAAQARGNNYLDANPEFTHETLYATPAPRTPEGVTTTKTLVESANRADWQYTYAYSSSGDGSSTITPAPNANAGGNCYEDLNWYDYYLVRGFAVVETAGIGSAGSDGYASCGADIEINGFKAVIEWLTGDRKAYSDKTSNIEIKADWSNGNVGMTGRSYAGTTQFGLSTTGVKGLKTIVPVAGIASWYEYTNGQGIVGSSAYSTGLSWYVFSRLASPEWKDNVDGLKDRYTGFSQLMRREELALNGEYGPHWLRRDYTVDGWYTDTQGVKWGPSQIKTPMLIVHGANDNNVRPKQSEMMYRAAVQAGVPVKMLWHQGNHMTPTFPLSTPGTTQATGTGRPYSMLCGDYMYDEILNLWFSHWLYGVDNDVDEKIPGALVLNNATGEWDSWDSWASPYVAIFDQGNYAATTPALFAAAASAYPEPEEPVQEEYPIPSELWVPNEDESGANEIVEGEMAFTAASADDRYITINSENSGTWTNFLSGSTEGAYVYAVELPEDFTVKGVVEVHLKAALTAMGSNAAPRLHAKIVEVAAPGANVNYFGANTFGSEPAIASVGIGTRGVFMGGGITNFNATEYRQATATSRPYREIARGWTDLRFPTAAFESYTVTPRVANDDLRDVYHDYQIHLQPAAHTAQAGNKLVLIIGAGSSSGTSASTGNSAFSLTIDQEGTYALVPSAAKNSLSVAVSELALTTDANLVQEGDAFTLNTAFTAEVESNAAVLTYTFDADKFEYAGFAPAAGITALVTDDSVPGTVKITVMGDAYNIQNFGDIELRAKEDINLQNGSETITVNVEYVLMNQGKKVIVNKTATATFTTYNPPESFTLIDLSDIIDWLGITNTHPEWKTLYTFWDFNNSGSIDIYDVAYVAQNIK